MVVYVNQPGAPETRIHGEQEELMYIQCCETRVYG
jgi:hypothetical protein